MEERQEINVLLLYYKIKKKQEKKLLRINLFCRIVKAKAFESTLSLNNTMKKEKNLKYFLIRDVVQEEAEKQIQLKNKQCHFVCLM